MDADETPVIALLVEADADERTARRLIDRQLRARVEWHSPRHQLDPKRIAIGGREPH